MTRVIYAVGKRRLERMAHSTRFLLSDHDGGYLALGAPNASNYDGYYARRGERYKTLFDIAPLDPIERITVAPCQVERISASSTQTFRIDARGVAMRARGEFTLTLDCKRQYDEREDHRLYDISIKPAHDRKTGGSRLANVTIITITYRQSDYTIFAVIATTLEPSRIGTWREISYPYDERRGSHATCWVYDALMLTGDGSFGFATGKDLKEAEQHALSLLIRPPALGKTLAGPPERALVWNALDSLRAPEGTLAGYPWFFDVWSRDELMSIGAFIVAGEHDAAIAAVDRWCDAISDNGEIFAMHPRRGLVSADAPGLLAKRMMELASHIDDRRADRWRSGLELLAKNAMLLQKDGLIWTASNTTWMDTSAQDGGRSGARIEIQALTLLVFDALAQFSARLGCAQDPAFLSARERLRAAIPRLIDQDRLLDGVMPDGTPDRAVRPNLFLAWYANPSLFSDTQWGVFFASALTALSLEWGGIASLSSHDPLFLSRDTGEDTAAYHRGDSWYFVNACAAMAIAATMPDRRDVARRMIAASLADLLDEGYLGHCSEISSAALQEAMGCHAQAWSAALLFEALTDTFLT